MRREIYLHTYGYGKDKKNMCVVTRVQGIG